MSAPLGKRVKREDGYEAPDSKLQKSAKSAEARAAVRAVVRARAYARCSYYIDSIDIENSNEALEEVKRQLDELDKDEKVQTTEEYDEVIKTLKLIETQYKDKAAKEGAI